MNWREAEALIRQKIIAGTSLDRRVVLDGPDYLCLHYDYAGEKGYKIKIGVTTCIDIPFPMLQSVFEDAIANNRTYENKVFKKKYAKQLIAHPCHVHVIGRIFEKAGVAIQIDKRRYNIK